MAYGIELRNTSGKVVISTASKQLDFHEKITQNVAAWSGLDGHGVDPAFGELHKVVINTTLTDSSHQPVVYYEPETRDAYSYQSDIGTIRGYVPVQTYYESGVWKIAIARVGRDDGVTAHSNNVVLYVFVEKDPGAGGWGIQTFSTDGSLAFDSSQQPLAINASASFVRGSDTFIDQSQNGALYWELGYGTLTVPAAAQVPSYAISAPPFFYGGAANFAASQSSVDTNYAVGVLVKDSGSPYLLRAGVGFIGGVATGGGRAMSGPIWGNLRLSFIDGSMYS